MTNWNFPPHFPALVEDPSYPWSFIDATTGFLVFFAFFVSIAFGFLLSCWIQNFGKAGPGLWESSRHQPEFFFVVGMFLRTQANTTQCSPSAASTESAAIDWRYTAPNLSGKKSSRETGIACLKLAALTWKSKKLSIETGIACVQNCKCSQQPRTSLCPLEKLSQKRADWGGKKPSRNISFCKTCERERHSLFFQM